ncbi:uncharacterized protein LOC107484460 [Arachis duranensis]|uniref:Uncharacterized protein LOC107484460 n=1 Tax=Arachis duranensis TaxID=130453 RepID=A0A9C6TGB0_ARADU|nr:uncharacterized protein LOC107484460 [Arachis duranensis]
MGYIQSGRNALSLILRRRCATNLLRNPAKPPFTPSPSIFSLAKRRYSAESSTSPSSRIVHDLLAEVENERLRERDQRIRAGLDTADIDAECEEDYMGVAPLVERLEKAKPKDKESNLNLYEELSDSDTDEDDERFTPEALQNRFNDFEKKFNRHKDLLNSFVEAETLDEAFRLMSRIDKFEDKHFKLRPEYRVIGELMNRLKVETDQKQKFVLQNKLNRAMRLVQWKEAYDPENPANYGVIQHEQVGPNVDALQNAGFEKGNRITQGENADAGADEDAKDVDVDDEEEEFDDMKEKYNILLAKLDAIDRNRKLEEKLAELEYTFGRKGKLLEEEIRDLAEERNELTEKRRKPLYRKGFDVKLIDVNRTCKVTKGGQVINYTAMLACGNYNGVVGFAKAKGPAVPVALQKAYEKCFQNLHSVERHEEHTIAHSVQTSYKKTKVYLWPASTTTGMKAGRIVQTILHLAGFKNVKSKVIGSRNPHNTVKAVFKALNAIETPRDVQEKFGRTVVEKYLL